MILRQPLLEFHQPVHVIMQQAIAVHHIDTPACLRLAQAFIHHDPDQLLGNARTCRSRSEEGDIVIFQRFVQQLAGGQQGARRDRRRALNIIIIGAEFIAVFLQQRFRMGLGKILELQQDIRPFTLYCLHELVDKLEIGIAGDTFLAPADIHRIVEPFLIIRSYIEDDGQCHAGIDATRRRIKRQLADGNAHAARALIAKAENTLAIGDDNRLHRLVEGVIENAVDVMAVRVGNKQPARSPVNLTELLAGLADHRGVDQRHHLLDMDDDQIVIQHFIGILKGAQIDMPLQVRIFRLDGLIGPRRLLLQRLDMRRQQAEQTKRLPLLQGKGRALVQDRLAEKRQPDRVLRWNFRHHTLAPHTCRKSSRPRFCHGHTIAASNYDTQAGSEEKGMGKMYVAARECRYTSNQRLKSIFGSPRGKYI